MNPDDRFLLTTFVSPQLFWLIDVNNTKRIEINNTLVQVLQKNKSTESHSFKVKEHVIIKVNEKPYRAIIESITNLGSKLKKIYSCFLIDYGQMVEAKKLYKLPENLQLKPPAQALQACLVDFAYVQQEMDYESGKPVTRYSPTVTALPGIREIVMGLLNKCCYVKFKLKYEENGIFFGDILCIDKNEEYSLTNRLFDKNVLIRNDTMFSEIKKSINDYKENHLNFILGISKKVKFLLENDIENGCKNLVTKYKDEFMVMSEIESEVTPPSMKCQELAKNSPPSTKCPELAMKSPPGAKCQELAKKYLTEFDEDVEGDVVLTRKLRKSGGGDDKQDSQQSTSVCCKKFNDSSDNQKKSSVDSSSSISSNNTASSQKSSLKSEDASAVIESESSTSNTTKKSPFAELTGSANARKIRKNIVFGPSTHTIISVINNKPRQ